MAHLPTDEGIAHDRRHRRLIWFIVLEVEEAAEVASNVLKMLGLGSSGRRDNYHFHPKVAQCCSRLSGESELHAPWTESTPNNQGSW